MGRGQRASRIASAIRAASTAAFTSWVRKMCAPFKINAVWAARFALSRSTTEHLYHLLPRHGQGKIFWMFRPPVESLKPASLENATAADNSARKIFQIQILGSTAILSRRTPARTAASTSSRSSRFTSKHNVAGRQASVPFFGTSAHVHQNDSAFIFSRQFCHLRIPAHSADIVHDLCAFRRSGARHAGFIGINGNHCVRALLFNRRDHWQHAMQFLLRAHGLAYSGAEPLGRNFRRTPCWLRRCGENFSPGSRRFSAHVNNVRAFVEQLKSACSAAASESRYEPPSEKESGVTLTMPMISVRLPSSSARVPRFHWKTLLMPQIL